MELAQTRIWHKKWHKKFHKKKSMGILKILIRKKKKDIVQEKNTIIDIRNITNGRHGNAIMKNISETTNEDNKENTKDKED